MPPKITLIISTYNRPELLVKALDSAALQSHPPDEVIIADDGSSADIDGVLRGVAPSVPFKLRMVTHADDGFRLARVRNNAARIATGELLVSTDQDLVFTRDFIKTYAENAHRGRFMVGYPVRLTREQTEAVTDEMIRTFGFDRLVTAEQRAVVAKQWRKDLFYRVLKTLWLRKIGAKLRGGVFAAWREDFMAVNGFDENYRGWGNEDDDLGHRLHAYGVLGVNPFRSEFPLHLWHPTNSGAGRVNLDYYRKRLAEIGPRDYRALNGVDNPLGGDVPEVYEYR